MSPAAWLQSALHPAGPDAAVIAQLTWVLFIGGTLLFIGVMVLCAMSLRGGRPVRPMVWIIGGGVLLPLVLLSALLVFGTWRSAQLSKPTSQHAIKISVIARMWWWEVRYTDPAGGEDIVLANEIRVPLGQPVYLGLSSADVIHSFWVPALAGKVDMVPGRVHGMTLQADRAGVYRAQCAEYCGEQHARMALHVVAQSPAEFLAWLAAQARPAGVMVQGVEVERGRRAFDEQRCAACHTIRTRPGANTPTDNGGAALGPDLTHVGSRLYLGAGTLRNGQGALVAWIADPHVAKPGVRMPASADMDGATLRALAAYLEQLK
ncbi:cytochrome c oxidase subunit 2 [Duganella sp. CF517]|uniref:cytochrome c oxidase subunit II n=1 Tax=Duganella sp. CF517 TaxID=1881038 RepID=UPI0008C0DFB3|nr:c-type cytochrome [Duganella sp. CF517]SEN11624.1 cytochrome c oxidase subunit 2 [Duganella sp. CF517]